MKQNNQTIKDKDMNKENTTTTIVKTIHELSLRVKAIRELPLRIVRNGMLFAIGFFGTTILAVSISGTIKTWTTGEVLKSADLNTTIASLQTAIQNIPNWTKVANGNDAYYTAGNVGIGTASPSSTLTVKGAGTTTGVNFQTQNSAGTALITGLDSGNVGIGTASPSALLHTNSSNPIFGSNFTTAWDGNDFSYATRINSGSSNGGILLSNSNTAGPALVFNRETSNSTNMWWSIQMDANKHLVFGGAKQGTGYISNLLFLSNTGLIGIGTNNPSVALHVVGAACSTGGGGLTACASDKRLKENVKPIPNALETIMQLNPVSFTWNKLSEKEFGYKEGQKDIGVIAQEVEKINPEWVKTTKSDYKAVNDTFVKWYSVKAIQELAFRLRSTSDSVSVVTQKIESLEKEKAANQKKLLALEEDNKRLRETVETLRVYVETHGRASLRLEDRLRAIENMQMARK